MNKLSQKRLVDGLIEAYVSWREACLGVSDAYGFWASETGAGATSAIERFGSKRTWIASIALFALGSGLCALATSASELIVFRILQGLGGGMLMPVGFTLIAQSAGPRRVGRALGVVGVPILLGPIFGPIIGCLIVDSAYGQCYFLVKRQ